MDMLNANVDVSLLNQKQYKKIDTKDMNQDDLRGACDNFESFFMQQLLDISLKNTNIAGGGTGDDIIKGMYTESLSKASAGSLGISDMLYRFLSDKKGK
jgi:Rod binding domain-containing protein